VGPPEWIPEAIPDAGVVDRELQLLSETSMLAASVSSCDRASIRRCSIGCWMLPAVAPEVIPAVGVVWWLLLLKQGDGSTESRDVSSHSIS